MQLLQARGMQNRLLHVGTFRRGMLADGDVALILS